MKPLGRKPNPNGALFRSLAADVAFAYVCIVPCEDCGRPAARGYVCSFCGSDDPDRLDREDWSPDIEWTT